MTKDDLLSYIREKFNYPIGFFESDAVNAALKLYDIIRALRQKGVFVSLEELEHYNLDIFKIIEQKDLSK